MPDAPLTTFERLQGLAARALSRLPPRLQLALSGRPPTVIDGQTLDAQSQLVLAIQRRLGREGLCPTPAEGRAQFRRDMLSTAGPKTAVGAVRDFEIDGADGPLRARHYAPDGGSRDLLVFLHGGGFVIGDLDTHDDPCRLVCRHAATHVLSVDYRLAPEHPFPAALDDARAALRWAQVNAASLGAEAARVSIGGDSAGANLSAVVSRLAARDGHAPPAAQLLIYPPCDGVTPRASWKLFGEGFFLTLKDRDTFFRRYLEGTGTGRDDLRVSPLLAAHDLAGLADAFVVTAGFDLLRDEGEDYAAALEAAGARVRLRRFPALSHGFVNMTSISRAARIAVIELAQDWRAFLKESSHEIQR